MIKDNKIQIKNILNIIFLDVKFVSVRFGFQNEGKMFKSSMFHSH